MSNTLSVPDTASEPDGAAAGILTTAQQFGVASGVAVIGAVFYTRLGPAGSIRASSVSAMEVAMAINAAVVLASAALTTLLPRQSPARTPGARRASGPGPGPRGSRRRVQRRGAPLTTPFTAASACPPTDEVGGPAPNRWGQGHLHPGRLGPAAHSQDGVMTTLRAEFSAALENTS